ncbi:hypothetical protein ACPXCX_48715, partial [Streptomyces sp. DT225]
MARRADEQVVPTRVMLPRRVVDGPARQVAKRLMMALMVLAITVFIVWIDRDGYHDAADGKVVKTVSPSSEEVLSEVVRAGAEDVD